MNRREFLKRSAVAAGAAVLPVAAVEVASGGVAESSSVLVGEQVTEFMVPKAVLDRWDQEILYGSGKPNVTFHLR